MHVGLNLVFLVPGETGGTETYARELVGAMRRTAPDVRFTAFVNDETARSPVPAPWLGEIPVVRVPVRARRRALWVWGEQALLPHLAARAGVDLVHSLANTGPLSGDFRRVVTIHDLHFKLVPEAHLGANALGMRLLVTGAARRADRVIVPAASTRADLERFLKIPPHRVDVIPEGCGSARSSHGLTERQVRERLGAGELPIVLSVSAKRPHKNLAKLIAAVARIPAERRPLLVIPGYPTAYERELEAQARALGVADHVRLLGWIDDDLLEGLYAAATSLVCASLHEGFGLPVLEAMTRGVPVACSDRGALAEVAGEAAILFDPESEEQISAAVERLLADPAERMRLREAGLERAARFTWGAAAVSTLETYARALSSTP